MRFYSFIAILLSIMKHREKEAYSGVSFIRKLIYWNLIKNIRKCLTNAEQMFLSSYIIKATLMETNILDKKEKIIISPNLGATLHEFFPKQFRHHSQFENDKNMMLKYRYAILDKICYRIDELPGTGRLFSLIY